MLESWDSMRSGLTGFSSLLARGRSFCIFFGTKLLKGKDTINTKNGEEGFSGLLARRHSFQHVLLCIVWKNYWKANFQVKDTFKAKWVLQEKENRNGEEKRLASSRDILGHGNIFLDIFCMVMDWTRLLPGKFPTKG